MHRSHLQGARLRRNLLRVHEVEAFRVFSHVGESFIGHLRRCKGVRFKASWGVRGGRGSRSKRINCQRQRLLCAQGGGIVCVEEGCVRSAEFFKGMRGASLPGVRKREKERRSLNRCRPVAHTLAILLGTSRPICHAANEGTLFKWCIWKPLEFLWSSDGAPTVRVVLDLWQFKAHRLYYFPRRPHGNTFRTAYYV